MYVYRHARLDRRHGLGRDQRGPAFRPGCTTRGPGAPEQGHAVQQGN